jgi:hypothetical protein
MAFPDDYWASYEHRVYSLPSFLQAVRNISAFEAASDARFVWRGVKNASWGLHSRLFRAYQGAHGETPTERQLRAFEQQVLVEAREWGLDWHTAGGRLSALEILATLQHFDIPTRLIDFTFSPLVALWFAVEDDASDDGRIFAIDISTREITRTQAASADPFWIDEYTSRTDTPWTTRSWAWRPPPMEARIARQESCFLVGGVPSTQPRRVYRAARRWADLRAEDVRNSMSVPIELVRYARAEAAGKGGKVPAQPNEIRTFTLRVANKRRLRADLENSLGLTHRSLFPDLTGFSQYGRSWRI